MPLGSKARLVHQDMQDLTITAGEYRFGPVNRLPQTIDWLSDNGSGCMTHDTKSLARKMGLEPRITPAQSPQSKGVAEAFVHTIKLITSVSARSAILGR